MANLQKSDLHPQIQAALAKLVSQKHRNFVLGVIKGLSATKSAEEAGYSPRSAHNQGRALMTRADISEAIQDIQDVISTDAQITATAVVTRINDMARADITQVLEWDSSGRISNVRTPAELPLKTRRAIKKFKSRPVTALGEIVGHQVEVEMHDQIAANKLLGEMLGVFNRDFDKAIACLQQFGSIENTPDGFIFRRKDAHIIDAEELT